MSDLLRTNPGTRLVLKWRTFIDREFRSTILARFAERGVAPNRIDLRPASFHPDMLGEYADIDIALDPFPFTGGLTTCEALWMSVPVVTLTGNRVVGRQGYAIAQALGLPELAARDENNYRRIASGLARAPDRLAALRSTLRDRMRASPLMDVAGRRGNLKTP